ncbi:MAG: DsbC family protein [Pseudomonadota bacterium]
MRLSEVNIEPKSLIRSGALLGIGLVAGALLLSPNTNEASAQMGSVQTAEAFAERFPETVPDSLDCNGFGPLCQVVAGKTVFYVDPDARHAFIGRLYDLDAKQDLTEATLISLRPPETNEADTPILANAATWDTLPFESAILRNRGGALKVAVFSDINCGYCRNLSASLRSAPDIEVSEFLVGMAGSADASRRIGCANDPERALETYYATRAVPSADCDHDIVLAAQTAARRLGTKMQGTPTFVRPDGAVTSGFRDINSLRSWLETPTAPDRETSQ